MAFFESIIATLIVSFVSLIGIVAIILNKKSMDKITKVLIAFAAGGLMGGAFLHLIPESVELISEPFIWIIVGFFAFYLLERVLKWRHCHEGVENIHTVSYMSIIGDAIHNFIDGIVIAASFATNFSVGISTTIAVILHEIPQEIGDFAILIYSGFSTSKALFYNFLTALAAVLGAVIFFALNEYINFSNYMLPIAAGGFIYIAASDLIPELHKEENLGKSLAYSLFFAIGIAIMWLFVFLE